MIADIEIQPLCLVASSLENSVRRDHWISRSIAGAVRSL
jgi:hypothetical protein